MITLTFARKKQITHDYTVHISFLIMLIVEITTAN